MTIVVYSKPLCAPCVNLKRYLAMRGVAYIEKDLNEPQNASTVLRLAGRLLAPTVIIDDEVVVGLNYGRLNSLLAPLT